LVILFLIVKKFLCKPITKALDARKKELDDKYTEAEENRTSAIAEKNEWEEKLATADDQSKIIIDEAVVKANKMGDEIIDEAKVKADNIINKAKNDAKYEMIKAESDVKKEIVEMGSLLSEKILGREIKEEDHRSLIDNFIDEMEGGDDEADD
jgi:F-type H+-transporting ATPase subunit b